MVEILFLWYSYRFFVLENDVLLPFYLNILFAVLDAVQSIFPSRGRTEMLHFGAAYVSWVTYLASGLIAYRLLALQPWAEALALVVMAPILAMFIYMHVNRTKLYPYQLAMVPLFVVYMTVLTIGTI